MLPPNAATIKSQSSIAQQERMQPELKAAQPVTAEEFQPPIDMNSCIGSVTAEEGVRGHKREGMSGYPLQTVLQRRRHLIKLMLAMKDMKDCDIRTNIIT